MDNFTRLTTADLETLAHLLCELMDKSEHQCDGCPVRTKCWPMHNGFKEWLKEDAKCGKSMKQSD